MILEGLISSRNPDGSPHLAPMGPHVEGVDFRQFVLRPFPTSQTYQNLLMHPEGVLHVTDDALLIAKAAIGIPPKDSAWVARPESAKGVGNSHTSGRPLPSQTQGVPPKENDAWFGLRLSECHRFYEFRVTSIDNSEQRIRMTCDVVYQGQGTRPWFGFNRARHAVLEAAILATRVHLLPKEQLESEFRVLQLIVDKTGGEEEKDAMPMLLEHVRGHS